MALTDVTLRNAKARDADYKLADAGGLYLLVTPSGGNLWRLKYRMHGVERKLSFGRYPEVTLGAARKARDAAREVATTGDDRRRSGGSQAARAHRGPDRGGHDVRRRGA